MKKMLALLLALLALNMTAAVAEGMFDVDETESNTCGITAYHGPGGEVVIPEQIGGLPVTFIAYEAFANNHEITSVVLPEGLENIQYGAFYGCDALESVQLPSTLLGIEEQAFAYCSALAQIDLPDNMYYIGAEAFGGCSRLVLSEDDLAQYEQGGTWALEQQATFTGERTDLSGWLGGSLPEFNQTFGPMEMSSESYTVMEGAMFYGEGVSSYTYDEEVLEEIHLSGVSGYSLFGAYVGMDAAEALGIAEANDFSIEMDGSGIFPLIHACENPANGASLRIFEEADGTVSEIQYCMPW